MATLSGYNGKGIKFSHSVDECPNDGDFMLHVHDDYELYCVVSGNVGYVVEGRIYELTPGSLMIMRSAEIHKLLVYGNERYERFTLNFAPEFLLKYGFDRSILDAFLLRDIGEQNRYSADEFSGIEPLGVFRQMETSMRGDPSEATVAAYVSALLCAVNTVFHTRLDALPTHSDNFEKKLISYINEHLLADVSLKSISEHMHMSSSQINRIFNKMTGTSVYNYVLSKRLVYAQGMILRGENANIACQACGFKDYSSFFRLYKKRFGVSPAESRKGSILKREN